jgi:hypothetical protein
VAQGAIRQTETEEEETEMILTLLGELVMVAIGAVALGFVGWVLVVIIKEVFA